MTISKYDALACMGNRNHIRPYIKYFETRIQELNEEQELLPRAPNYYAWLSMSSEYVFFLIRDLLFFSSQRSEVFDDDYSKLLNKFKEFIKPHDHTNNIIDDVILFASIRHIFVHKGFPNVYEATVNNSRNMCKDVSFTPQKVVEVLELIKAPKSFSHLKQRFDHITKTISNLQDDFTIDLGFGSLSRKSVL